MKKLMNKKGFTLVELLAVIVILAVIILVAMNAVLPAMEESRKGTFKTEVEVYAKAAGTYYTTNLGAGDSTLTAAGGCVSIDKLHGKYVEKNSDDYSGSVKIEISGGKTTYKVWLSNKVYQVSGKTLAEVENDPTTNIVVYTADASTNCGA